MRALQAKPTATASSIRRLSPLLSSNDAMVARADPTENEPSHRHKIRCDLYTTRRRLSVVAIKWNWTYLPQSSFSRYSESKLASGALDRVAKETMGLAQLSPCRSVGSPN